MLDVIYSLFFDILMVATNHNLCTIRNDNYIHFYIQTANAGKQLRPIGSQRRQ